ncbi:hypothetical protein HS041_06690 [Planomonospora sp. ID67723]|uniref:hypothetical protein n=1 Tax=Planomonospora sp. ID67723 TaxID=2738134 RepID=UPI0018C38478|nr:hypothetical protein [Planomonospora sp. ID67723]MBG0827450.1 hypothetical protein [Planomonospora sp. ID67723]
MAVMTVCALLTGCQSDTPPVGKDQGPPTPGPIPPTHLKGGWPGPDNTGVPDGIRLRSTKAMKVTVPGAVIDGVEVFGDIDISADDVTIRNVRVHAPPGEWGIIQRSGYSGLTIEDSEVFGNGKDRTQIGILNQGVMLTVRRTDVHTITDGVVTNQGLVEDSYIHDPEFFEGDHSDLIAATGGPAEGKDLVIRRNTIINSLGQTGAIGLFQDFGVVHDVLIENNLIAGGGYSIYAGGGKMGKTYNIRVIANMFSRRVWPKGGYHGPLAYWDLDGKGNEWRGNVWEDGKPVPTG